jgi:hypothetical protein
MVLVVMAELVVLVAVVEVAHTAATQVQAETAALFFITRR